MKKGVVRYADDPKEWRRQVDIETMRGEIIAHKGEIQVLKSEIADLQARLTKLENDVSDKPVVNQSPIPGR